MAHRVPLLHVLPGDRGHVRLGRLDLVKRQRSIAVAALERVLARRAEHEIAVPPPVQQQDRLLLAGQHLGQMLRQRHAQQIQMVLPEAALPHIDQPHLGHGQIHHPLGQPHQLEALPRPAVLQALQRRRRGAQNAVCSGQLGPLDRDIPPVVARGRILLVARLMLLIDDDQPQIGNRRKNRRPGPNHDIRLPRPSLLPLLVPLPGGQPRMQHRNPVEPGGKPLHRLGGQRNLRQQHNGGLALAHAPARSPECRSPSCRCRSRRAARSRRTAPTRSARQHAPAPAADRR